MIQIINKKIDGFEAAIRGLRNPMNSWDESDSKCMFVGKKDLNLMMKLVTAGDDHSKFMRFITVTADITAPLYWWKEFDTYKVGTVANSCSTMHTLHKKEFELSDFSHEHMNEKSIYMLQDLIRYLNGVRKAYVESLDTDYWWQMIQLLPSSYNQKRTVLLNYQVLRHMYQARKNHKLDEWRWFCGWIQGLTKSELITTGGE